MIGSGPVGGVVVDFEGIGRQASRVILAILSGAEISTFPIERSRNNIMVDWRAFERFQLPQEQLPPSATVLHRLPPVWVRYGWYFIVGGLIILIQLILILKLTIEGNRRKESERSARELAGSLIYAQEEERRRIAGELHDDVSQRLALVCLQIDTMRESPPTSKEDLVQELSVLYDETDLISSDIHQFSHKLHPSVLEKLGLVSALRRYCSEFSEHRKIAVNLQVTGEEPLINRETALALFRIGQECLMNVAKHSNALSCDVRLNYKNDRVTLDIADLGVGFDLGKLKEDSGLGIESMRERLRSIGGTLHIESNLNRGTKVHAEVHVMQAAHAELDDITQESSNIPVA
jgi:signal transduction histidine kinase